MVLVRLVEQVVLGGLVGAPSSRARGGGAMNAGVQRERVIREEEPADAAGVHEVELQAFGQPDEARMVEALRRAGALTLSLVCIEDGELVGHAVFSPVVVETPTGAFAAVGLGPLAVLPRAQRTGVGGALIRAGLAALRSAGHEVLFVLGHPSYYPRFGFRPASGSGLRWEHPCPDAAFMVLELREGALARRSGGIVRYRPELGSS